MNISLRVCLQEDGVEFLYNEHTVRESPNITDRWILSFMQSLIGFFETEMAGESSYAVFLGTSTIYSPFNCPFGILTFHLLTWRTF